MTNELLVTNVRPLHGEAIDLRAVGSSIAEMGAGLKPTSPDATVIDLRAAGCSVRVSSMRTRTWTRRSSVCPGIGTRSVRR